MPTINDVQTWSGRDAVDNDGDKVGAIKDIYLDRQSGEPEWAAVKTGLFGTKVSFVPLEGASAAGDEVRLAYDKATIKDAPNVEADGELSPEEESRLYDHYGRGDYGDWDDSSDDRTEGVAAVTSGFAAATRTSAGSRAAMTTTRRPMTR